MQHINDMLEVVKGNCIDKLYAHKLALSNIEQKITEAKTISELMEVKVRWMLESINFPIRDTQCPFCQMYKANAGNRTVYKCQDCWYASYHGGQCDNNDSIYRKLQEAHEYLKEIIKQYWSAGDTVMWNSYLKHKRTKEHKETRGLNSFVRPKLTYQIGDVISAQGLHTNLVIAHSANSTIQLLYAGTYNDYNGKQVSVENEFEITEAEVKQCLNNPNSYI